MSEPSLKRIRKETVPRALDRAKHYRLLNDPEAAESICLDVLEVEPGHQDAQVVLLLALTDQLVQNPARALRTRARELALQLEDPYARAYYQGLVCERMGRAALAGPLGGHVTAHAWLHDALQHYEAARALAPSDNDDAVLRWNSCVRVIERHRLTPQAVEPAPRLLE